MTGEETCKHLRRINEAETEEEIQSILERRVSDVADEGDFERISEATLAVAKAFNGMRLHAGHELVTCPDCSYEGQLIKPSSREEQATIQGSKKG